MKKLICGILITLFGCQTQNSLIDAHFSYDGRFSDYRSFSFLRDGSLENLQAHDQSIIENMIFKRFTAMGYQYQPEGSDLLITYRYFEEGANLVTIDQENLKSWVSNKGMRPTTEEDRKYQPKREHNENGTLSVYIIDGVKGQIIFQAFFKDYQQAQSDYMIISSVGRMLDKYKVTSYKF